MVSNYGLEQIGIMDKEVHFHDCGMLASSPEETRPYRFCHLKVFDARRRVIGGDDAEEQEEDRQQEAAASRLKDANYWLCPDCF